jgi:hypothetical protein
VDPLASTESAQENSSTRVRVGSVVKVSVHSLQDYSNVGAAVLNKMNMELLRLGGGTEMSNLTSRIEVITSIRSGGSVTTLGLYVRIDAHIPRLQRMDIE